MSVINNNLLMTPEGYQISRSVRLRSSASAYFNRTPASPTDNKKWTFSCWFKRGALGATQYLLTGGDATYRTFFAVNSSDQLQFGHYDSSTPYTFLMNTTAVFRDPSAWYHFLFVFDSAQATNSNGCKAYVNGVQQTLTFSNYTQNGGTTINNSGYSNWIGWLTTTGAYLDGYLTEVNFIDGQALTPSSFGETDAVTGVWKPKKYAGTYGTNGFYLNFSDNSNNTATTIGKDYSGNGNNWTPNNISVTAGVSYDSVVDVPTMWADGGNGRGNYCTLNPLDTLSGTITEGNLAFTSPGTGYGGTRCTMATPTTGKWYWEVTVNAITGGFDIGISSANEVRPVVPGESSASYGYKSDGAKRTNGADTVYGAAYTTNDVIGVALDLDAGTLVFYKNNTSQGTAFSSLSGSFLPMISDFSNSAVSSAYINFGQRPFSYTPPTGFKALNTQNLPEPTIKKGNQYFDALTWTANGTTQNVTGLQFSPDFWWEKGRSAADGNAIADIVRGATSYLISHSTAAEVTNANFISGFLSNGVSYGSANHTNGQTYVGWAWKEGATQGFDIVTYTGTGANRTVAHSLGVTPSMMIVKSRSSGADGWPVFHSSVGNGSALVLNSTSAINTNSVWWNNTSPSSSVFTVGTNTGVNGNAATYVAYLFAEVAGFSKFGSYTGNGSADGPFVYCGFRPRFLLVKRTDSTGSWQMKDTARNPSNLADLTLFSNLSNAEYSTFYFYDLLSNGFKVRSTDAELNASGGTYIYAAFAENPFKNSLAR